MEIVTIEKKTFELWQEKFNHFINRMAVSYTHLRAHEIHKSITRFIIRFRTWKPLCKIT